MYRMQLKTLWYPIKIFKIRWWKMYVHVNTPLVLRYVFCKKTLDSIFEIRSTKDWRIPATNLSIIHCQAQERTANLHLWYEYFLQFYARISNFEFICSKIETRKRIKKKIVVNQKCNFFVVRKVSCFSAKIFCFAREHELSLPKIRDLICCTIGCVRSYKLLR